MTGLPPTTRIPSRRHGRAHLHWKDGQIVADGVVLLTSEGPASETLRHDGYEGLTIGMTLLLRPHPRRADWRERRRSRPIHHRDQGNHPRRRPAVLRLIDIEQSPAPLMPLVVAQFSTPDHSPLRPSYSRPMSTFARHLTGRPPGSAGSAAPAVGPSKMPQTWRFDAIWYCNSRRMV